MDKSNVSSWRYKVEMTYLNTKKNKNINAIKIIAKDIMGKVFIDKDNNYKIYITTNVILG